MAHAGGRPLKFKTPEELQERIDAYFADCDPHPELQVKYEYHQKITERKLPNGDTEEIEVNDYTKMPYEVQEWGISGQKPYTITGLANFLETSRLTLINYEMKPQFINTVKAAKARVEQYWENLLIGSNATGPIFNLKNNYGWKDKTESEITNPDGSLNPYNALTAKELRKLAGK